MVAITIVLIEYFGEHFVSTEFYIYSCALNELLLINPFKNDHISNGYVLLLLSVSRLSLLSSRFI
jgi:hypothetical protein